jgi:hypothetical protein
VRAVLAFVVWLAACYNEAAVTPCTLTCEDSPCPSGLTCMSDHVCQTPGMPLCSTVAGGDGGIRSSIYIKASLAHAGVRFGSALALSLDGNTLAVGAPLERYGAKDAGAVYVFAWNGSKYGLQQRIIRNDADDGDLFGASVSLSADGTVLAIGVPGDDSAATGLNGDSSNNGSSDSGAVYVFTRSGTNWSQSKYLKYGATSTNWNYGTAVALTPDAKFLAVTAPGPGNTGLVVNRWTLLNGNSVNANPLPAEVDDRIGSSVAILDDASALFAGAQLDDENVYGFTKSPPSPNNAAPDSGAMWFLGYSASYRYKFKATNPAAGDQFGTSVACSSDGAAVAVGAPLEDSASAANQADNSADAAGAVYVFDEPANTLDWGQTGYLKAPNPATLDHFGVSVSVAADGTRLVSGAPGRAGGGVAYMFERELPPGMTWGTPTTLIGSNTEAGDEFGAAVAISRNGFVTAVGAPGEASEINSAGTTPDPNNNNAPNAGAVYVFR